MLRYSVAHARPATKLSVVSSQWSVVRDVIFLGGEGLCFLRAVWGRFGIQWSVSSVFLDFPMWSCRVRVIGVSPPPLWYHPHG